MNYYFITGTSRGIGKALAEEILSKEDSFVFGFSRGCTIMHDRYKHFSIDLSDMEAVKQVKFDELNDAEYIALINNAGTLAQVKHLGKLDDENIIAGFNINVISPTILANKFIKTYNNYDITKVILNISSGAGKNPIDGWSVYCASKAAIDMMSRVVETEQKDENNNFHVFAVAPGIVDTRMQDEIRRANEEDFSRLNEFKEYKSGKLLADPGLVSKKLFRILHEPKNFKEVLLSVKNM